MVDPREDKNASHGGDSPQPPGEMGPAGDVQNKKPDAARLERTIPQPPIPEEWSEFEETIASLETLPSVHETAHAAGASRRGWREPDQETIGPYRIESEIGRGGMGIVYLAIDPRLDRQVALKLLRASIASDPSWCSQLETEAKLLASINHPNIATLHSLESLDGYRYLTMELVEGESLHHRLRSGPLPLDEALADARQIASALEAAHQRSVVHCDLKPANVMRRGDGVIKVLDFGLARRPESRAAGGETISGTPGFMSPEQIRRGALDARSDLFAFGSLVFECLTGSPAFPGVTAQERIESTLCKSPAFDCLPEATPEPVRSLLEQCLSIEPDSRPVSAAEVRRTIETAVASRALASRPAETKSRNPLPRPWTSFVGRSETRTQLAERIVAHPLVTLSGFGGCGKTRLALQVAEDVADRFRDGVSWIDLASMNDVSLFWHSVARALGLRDALQQSPELAVLRFLETRASLLVFDNCEHLVDVVASAVRKILDHAPSVHVLATSRERLSLPGETIVTIAPLAVPSERERDLADLESNESVQLFVERARAAVPGFELSAATAPDVADICRRLEGIPLAIELAAGRLRAIGPRDLAQRLSDRFRILRSGVKGSVAHHQTLESMVEWSHDLLTTEEAILLQRLSVFSGGWSLDAAEEVCAIEPLEGWQILDLMTGLVEKSLIEIDAEKTERTGSTRYRMLETVREYVAGKFRADSARAETEERHADAFVRFCKTSEIELVGSNEALWRNRFEADLDNMRAVFRRADENASLHAKALLLGANLGRCYDALGAWSEGRATLQRLLDRVPEREHGLLHARVLTLVGNLALNQGDLPESRAIQERALTMLRKIDMPDGIMMVLGNLANVLTEQGEYVRAIEMYEENLRLARELGNRWAEGAALGNLCTALIHVDLGRAEETARAGLAVFEELSNSWSICYSMINLATVLEMRDDLAGSQAASLRAAGIARQIGDRRGLSLALQQLSRNATIEGRWEDSRIALREALDLIRGLGDQAGVASILECGFHLAMSYEDDAAAARFLLAATEMRQRLGMPRGPRDASWIEERERALVDRLGADRYAQLASNIRLEALAELEEWLAAR